MSVAHRGSSYTFYDRELGLLYEAFQLLKPERSKNGMATGELNDHLAKLHDLLVERGWVSGESRETLMAPEFDSIDQVEVLTTAEAARVLGISEQAVRTMARSETLPARRGERGEWLFEAGAVRARAARTGVTA